MNMLSKVCFAVMLFFFALAAHALPEQTEPDQAAPTQITQAVSDQPMAPQILATAAGLHFVLNGGFTYGGDTIITAVRTDGTTDKIKGGALIQIGVGGLWQFANSPIALMLSANYHFDSIAASNGEASFIRFPVEMLAYYTGKERFRIGGGVRIVTSPEATMTLNGVTDKYTFENATGLVAEVGYQLAPHVLINVRAVSEKYQGKTHTAGGTTTSLAGASAIDGSHLGVNFSYEF